MKGALQTGKLADTWKALLGQVGPYIGEVGKRSEKNGQHDLVFVTTEFRDAFIDIRVVFSSDKRSAGLFFEPAEATAIVLIVVLAT